MAVLDGEAVVSVVEVGVTVAVVEAEGHVPGSGPQMCLVHVQDDRGCLRLGGGARA